MNADEVRRMLENATGQDLPWRLAEVVQRQTEGNPFFVQEVIRYLVEEGLLTRERGRWRETRDTPVEMSIPEALRDVISKRLSRLGPECNRLLSIAAVIGREFRLEVLQKVAGLPDEVLVSTLEEAKKAAVVEERIGVGATVNYRFAHAFFRQTLYEKIIAPRRIRLHQEVAKALEELHANRLEEHSVELAEHFSHSSDLSDLAKAVSYGEMAAHHAVSVYAYSEAVRLLEQALKIQEVLDPEDKAKRCDLLLALGDALVTGGEPRRVVDIEAPAAFSLAEAIGDTARAARVCILAMEALTHHGAAEMYATPEYAQWAERADYYGKPEP
jgi:predicted ATPase